MAHLCMDIAWGHMTGIGVCTHMNQIIHQLGWVKGALNTYECMDQAVAGTVAFKVHEHLNWPGKHV